MRLCKSAFQVTVKYDLHPTDPLVSAVNNRKMNDYQDLSCCITLDLTQSSNENSRLQRYSSSRKFTTSGTGSGLLN